MSQIDVFARAMSLFPRASRTSWLLLITLAAVSAAYSVLRLGQKLGWSDGIFLAFSIPVSVVIVYRLAVEMGGLPASFPAFFRFGSGYLLAFLPLIATFSVLLIGPRESGAIMVLFLVGLILGGAAVVLLQAWPASLAANDRWISPLRIGRATRGHRWKLAVSWFMLGITEKLPSPEAGRTVFENIGCALLEFGGSIFQTLFLAGVSVAAWQAAVRNDPGLRGSANLD